MHNHSEYSLLDSIAKSAGIVERLKELGYDAYALTDHGVMYGALEFYTAMLRAGLKPIIGCEVYVAPRKLTDKDPALDRHTTHLVLLAQDRAGYVNLMKLTSIAHQHGFYYKPRIDVQALTEHKEGLVALTACANGVVAGPFRREGAQAAREQLERYLRIFGAENFFLEIQNHGLEMEEKFRNWAVDAAREAGVRLVATNDCHYVNSDDARAHDIALCLRDKKLLSDTDRLKYSSSDFYIKGPEEMAQLFAGYPEALANTRAVADMCNLELDLEQVHFPRFTVPANGKAGEQATLDDYLRSLAFEGAARRYGKVTDELRKRIEYELSVIITTGFTTYFLICADFCSFARSKNIPVGPGRGSAAGSVIAYCLEITDIDPISYGLYFERFLNPERVELPDFDIDFCYQRRDEVIEHVKEKYGAGRVAQIVTFSRLMARAVIKAVGRAKGLEYQYVDRVTKEIRGFNSSIEEAVAASDKLQEMIAGDEVISELIEDAKRLEGIAAHHSVHAAGLVIAPDDLPCYVPVQPHKDTDMLVTQYAMDTVPLTGLVKFDILGLRNLTMIQDTVDYLRQHEGIELDPRTLPDGDEETFAMLRRGDAYGVFQFEAPQVKRMLIDGRPETVLDLAAINAANRPGPITSGNTERYLQNRKLGESGDSIHPSIAGILTPTGGILLYQEQVMEIARELGGFSLGEADILRKAMGKKNFEVMRNQQEKFLAGADKRGVPQQEARAIWEMMAKFAGYGFNKAHSVCYAWIAYQTAYLKCHHPQYFMCAMLNSFMGNADKLAQILAQCRRMRIPVLPPSVNEGAFKFTPTKGGGIIFGLGGIKGIGSSAVEAIVETRRLGGPYESLAGFFSLTHRNGVNRKVLQSLAMAGAFDCLQPDRKEMIRHLDGIEDFMRGPDKQEALFGDFDDGSYEIGALPTREVTERDVALLEKQAIGLFLTHHPFDNHPMYSDERYLQLAELEEAVQLNPARWQEKPLPASGLAGLLTNVQLRVASTSGKTYVKGRLEDPERSVSVIIWPRAYESAQDVISENSPLVLWGKVQIPEAAGQPEEAWDNVEIVADRAEAYVAGESSSTLQDAEKGGQRREGGNGEGNGSQERTLAPPQAAAPRDEYPFPSQQHGASDTGHIKALQINWEIDLARTEHTQLERLAKSLEKTQGDCEIRMSLKEISGQLRRIRVNRRFYTTLDVARKMEREFPFITPSN